MIAWVGGGELIVLMRLLVGIVEPCSRHARLVVLGGLVSAALLGTYTARTLSMNTDTASLVSSDARWRKLDQELDDAFPTRADQLVVVLDAQTSEQADAAAAALAESLQAKPALFKSVSNPEGSPFFRRNGLLFLSKPEVLAKMDELTRAQPMIGTLAADPSTRGLFGAR